jgi:hypothetical protein
MLLWRSHIGAGLEAVEEGAQMPLKVLRIGCRRLSVDPWGAIFPCASKRLAEEGYIDVMRQRRECPLRRYPSQCRYPVEFR